MAEHAILVDGEVKEVELLDWAMWYGKADRTVALTEFDGGRVSTVFLGLNHQFGGGQPLWFETMIFSSDDNDQYCERYTTLEEAMLGHERAVRLATGENAPPAIDACAGGACGR